MIVWDKITNAGIASFNIYKETTNVGVYALLANQPFSSFSTFIDNSSQPMVVAARYRMTTVDTCGSESDTCLHHKTIHLSVSQGNGNSWNLNWDAYEGLTFSTYYIMRGITPNNLIVIDSVQSNLYSYTDINPPNGTVYYAIEIEVNTPCSPSVPHGKHITSEYSYSMSNIENETSNGVTDLNNVSNAITIYPNPNDGRFILSIRNPDKSRTGYELEIYDVLGQEVYHQSIINIQSSIINVSKLSNGVYFYQLINNNKTVRGKFIKE
jgi:hypothetical protein